jgi:hypothetical protein
MSTFFAGPGAPPCPLDSGGDRQTAATIRNSKTEKAATGGSDQQKRIGCEIYSSLDAPTYPVQAFFFYNYGSG